MCYDRLYNERKRGGMLSPYERYIMKVGMVCTVLPLWEVHMKVKGWHMQSLWEVHTERRRDGITVLPLWEVHMKAKGWHMQSLCEVHTERGRDGMYSIAPMRGTYESEGMAYAVPMRSTHWKEKGWYVQYYPYERYIWKRRDGICSPYEKYILKGEGMVCTVLPLWEVHMKEKGWHMQSLLEVHTEKRRDGMYSSAPMRGT